MRKIYTLVCVALLAIFSSSIVSASPVSKETALKIAEKILSDDDAPSTRTSGTTLSLAWDGLNGDVAEDELPPYYVVTRDGGGFVIIAGDDNAFPVLGISDKGSFKTENMPSQVKWWMDRTAAYVRSCTIPTTETALEWSKFIGTRAASSIITGTITNKVERLTPEWDQGGSDSYYFGQQVFNKYCPTSTSSIGGSSTTSYTYAGCVPVAVAEIMTYLSGVYENMPTSASGTIQDYSSEYSGSSGSSSYKYPTFPYTLGTTYDWENLRKLTNINAIRSNLSNTDLINNLARLIADLGAVVHAYYTTSGTGADVMIGNLGTYFGMNKNAVVLDQSNYSASMWRAYLVSELDNNRPVLYGGYEKSGSSYAGHQFVLDGYGTYSGTTVFHFNFGWAGDCNGWYYVSDISTTNGKFAYYCDAVFNFYPAPDSQYVPKLEFYAPYTLNNVKYVGFSTSNMITAGSAFTFNCGLLYNKYGAPDLYGYIIVARSDKNYNITEVVTGYNCVSDPLPSGHYAYFNNSSYTPSEIAFGDKLIAASVDSTWTTIYPVTYPYDGTVVGELALMPAAFIYVEDSYSVGDYFQFVIDNYNSQYDTTTWTVTSPSGTKATYSQADREFQLSQTGRYEISAALSTGNGTATENVVTYIDVK